MRYLTNKRPGPCVDCGATVEPGGRMWKSGGQWKVSHAGACAPVESDDAPYTPTRGSRSIVFRLNSGAEVFVNARGRCEDAPCCGCCS